MFVVTPEEMRGIDQNAIEKLGIPGIVLMENAALKTLEFIEREYGQSLGIGNILLLVGGGNNGGDGLALARHLLLKGAPVKAALLVPEAKLKGDAKINLDIYKNLGGPIYPINGAENLEDYKSYIKEADLIVDSIFGTGIRGSIEEPFFKIKDEVNKSQIPVVSIDIPSGIDGKTGEVKGIGIKADQTVTFAYAKRGHLLYPGRAYRGELSVVPISLPEDGAGDYDVKAFSLDDGEISRCLKDRPLDGHKGSFGKLALIAGSLGLAGAASLASMGALKGGAGLVTLGCPKSLSPIFQSKTAELMTYPLEDEGRGHLSLKAISQLDDFIGDKDALAIGPGLGKKCDCFEILRYILGNFDIPIIMDADALNHISRETKLLSSYKGTIVVTPHPGEMSSLTGFNIEKILASPIEISCQFAKEKGLIVVLKGATTIVANPEGDIYLNTSGNSGMGTAGSGDILTGLIAALVAGGYSPYDAGVYGVFIHGRAGDYAAKRWGMTGMVAGDLLNELPLVFKDLEAIGS